MAATAAQSEILLKAADHILKTSEDGAAELTDPLLERATAFGDIERIRDSVEGAKDRASQVLGRNTGLVQRVLNRANVSAGILRIINRSLHRIAELTHHTLAGIGCDATKTQGDGCGGRTSNTVRTC